MIRQASRTWASNVLGKWRDFSSAAPKNLLDPHIHQHLALIAFFAWVGLGSDGLSSSCYGPEEAFLQLGAHRHLALYLVAATIVTVFLISASYSQIIEQFPTGGGGYLVATKLLGPVPGVISGVRAGGGLHPHHLDLGGFGLRRHLLVPAGRWQAWKLPAEFGVVGLADSAQPARRQGVGAGADADLPRRSW